MPTPRPCHARATPSQKKPAPRPRHCPVPPWSEDGVEHHISSVFTCILLQNPGAFGAVLAVSWSIHRGHWAVFLSRAATQFFGTSCCTQYQNRGRGGDDHRFLSGGKVVVSMVGRRRGTKIAIHHGRTTQGRPRVDPGLSGTPKDNQPCTARVPVMVNHHVLRNAWQPPGVQYRWTISYSRVRAGAELSGCPIRVRCGAPRSS
eukprot:gene18358-biopygen2404